MSSYALYIVLVPTVISIFKIYLKLTTGWCHSQGCLVGKTAVVTGANTGIGFEVALDFTKRGAKVILACRDLKKAEEARLRIIEETDNPKVFVKVLDLGSFKSVRSFAEEINENEERLDILVNNAGVAPESKEMTEDGHHLGMQVNYFSMFLLTNLLLSLMRKTGSSRIVNTSSILARAAAKFNIGDVHKDLGDSTMYSYSKLCIILFTKELAKRLQNTTITTYSLHPGAVKTDIFRHCAGLNYLFFTPIKNWFSKSSIAGAQTTIHCSVQKNIEHLSGQHFEDCRRISDYYTVKSFKNGTALWKITKEVVGLSREDNFVFN